MPRGDGTGNRGLGPMTGRGLGSCAGYPHPGYMAGGFGNRMHLGRGFGRGFNRGFGYGFGYPAAYGYAETEQTEVLVRRADELEQEVKRLREIIAEQQKGDK